MKKIVLIILFLTIPYSLIASPSLAQQVSLSISPPLLEAVIKPGKSIMIAYQLENLGDPTYVNLKVVSFEPRDNLGNPRIKDRLEGPIRFSLDNAQIQLERPFFLKTKDSQQILLRMRVPEQVVEGDYYYTLLAETVPLAAVEGVGSAYSKAAIGSNILMTVTESGNIDIKPKISLFTTIGQSLTPKIKIYDSFDKIPLIFIIDNKGKNLIKPEGEITLSGNFGEKASYDIIPKNILAQSQRLIEATPSSQLVTSHPLSLKLRRASQQPVTLVLSGFFVGKYTLSTTVNFGDNSPNLFASTGFIALPLKILGGTITAVILTIMVVVVLRKRKEED